MPEDTDRRKRKGNRSPWYGYLDFSGFPTTADEAVVFVLAILVLLGVVFLVYTIALAFTYVLSQGEIRKSRRYCKKVEELGLDEMEGYSLGKKLNRTSLYFSVVFFVFAVEEIVRFFLHTGPADLPIWIFRFACLSFFIAITGVFLVRLYRWRSFKSTQKYEQTLRQITKLESM